MCVILKMVPHIYAYMHNLATRSGTWVKMREWYVLQLCVLDTFLAADIFYIDIALDWIKVKDIER